LRCRNIDGQDIRIEENWSGKIEVKIDQVHIGSSITAILALKYMGFSLEQIKEKL